MHLVATYFLSGEPVVLSQGSVVNALLASMAIPIISPPHPVDGRLLTDGAVSYPLPVDLAIKEGCDIILTPGFELP